MNKGQSVTTKVVPSDGGRVSAILGLGNFRPLEWAVNDVGIYMLRH